MQVVSILARKGRCERASIDEVYLDLTDAAESMLVEHPPDSWDDIDDETLKSHIFGLPKEESDAAEKVKSWLCRSDADHHDKLLACGALIFAELRQQVLKETEFTCSAGIAHNKILAKLASGMNKPAQQTVVPAAAVQKLLVPLPIKKMKRLGGKLGDSLQSDLGVNTVGDLLQFSMESCFSYQQLRYQIVWAEIGFFGIELNNLVDAGAPMNYMAFELLKLLGFEDGKTSDESQIDLVFVHLGSNGKATNQEVSAAKDNNLVGEILQTSSQYSATRSRLHLSLVMSYGAVAEEDQGLLLSSLHDERNSNPSVLFPRQSYAMIGGKFRSNVRKRCPLLVVQWQEAVTRKDNTEMLTLNDFRKNSGSLVIPADRFLYEIAFKLWKAPKYGA